MVQRVYEQSLKASVLSDLIVATDHEAIYEHVKGFGGKVVMTSVEHQSGTDRCAEVARTEGYEADYVINIQGDEPFILPRQIETLAGVLDGAVELATLIKPVEDAETLFNPNAPKVVLNVASEVLYFSRHPIPYLRNHEPAEWLAAHRFYKHIGIYAYRADVLQAITQLTVSSLERAESLEQLRWLENGYRIKAVTTLDDSYGIDTPEDLDRVRTKFL